MALVLIPITNDPESEVSVKLEGVVYTFRLRWNVRSGAWFLDLRDANDEVLFAGRKLVVDWVLSGWRDTDPRLPPGRLLAYDTSGQQTDPTLDDLGTRVVLEYWESVP